jgi:uncharacterized membrane protein YhaH (DUF805 family)
MNPFTGSLNRLGFLAWSLPLPILYVVPLLGAMSDTPIVGVENIVLWLMLIVGLVLTLLILVRRLQDVGFTKWYLAVALLISIPLEYIVWLILFFVPSGSFRRNR